MIVKLGTTTVLSSIAASILLTGCNANLPVKNLDSKDFINLPPREELTFKIDGAYGDIDRDRLKESIALAMVSFSEKPARRMTSDGCVAKRNFECVRYDPTLRRYTGISPSVSRSGVTIKYEDGSKASYLLVPVGIKVTLDKGDNTYSINMKFPQVVETHSIGLLEATFNMLRSDKTPLGTADELKTDITKIFDNIENHIHSGSLAYHQSYSYVGEVKSEFSPESIKANFNRLSLNRRPTNETKTYRIDPSAFNRSGKKFYANIEINPYRSGSVVNFRIPLTAKLLSDGTSIGDVNEESRRSVVMRIIND